MSKNYKTYSDYQLAKRKKEEVKNALHDYSSLLVGITLIILLTHFIG